MANSVTEAKAGTDSKGAGSRGGEHDAAVHLRLPRSLLDRIDQILGQDVAGPGQLLHGRAMGRAGRRRSCRADFGTAGGSDPLPS